ncbi:MAG: FeoB-associated Cys-rich membrane protein [Oscillospiraceae bacterium]|nr:FeoB-associated Cys-rich membrane protein [Oscillospiraceae bacterium]
MDWPTIIVAAIVAIIFIAIVAKGIYNKKKGKSSCSCGGSCAACPMACGCSKQENG